MRATNRLLLITGVCVALAAVLGWRAATVQAESGAEPGLIGVVDVVKLLEEMLETGDYGETSSALRTEIESQLNEMQAQLVDLQQELQLGDPNSPEFAQKAQRFQGMQAQLQQTAQARSSEYDRLRATQAVEAYKRVLEATRTVADREGYRYVMSSRLPIDEIGNAEGLGAVTQQILARPIIHGAEQDDITPFVRAQLGLPEPGDASTPDDDGAGNATEPAGDEETNG